MAAGLSVMVLVSAVAIFLTGMRSWIGGQAGIDSLNSSQRALRVVANELREAMSLTVAADGKSVTYLKPLRDASGNFVAPVQPDGYTRTIAVDGNGTLTLSAQGTTRTLCKNLVSVDGGQAYSYFSPSAGSLTRSLAIKFISTQPGISGAYVTSRSREVVYLRNVPELSR